MSTYVVSAIDAVPSIDDEGVDWKPIQHYFQLTAFGINVYRATAAGVQVIGVHDEQAGRHEGLRGLGRPLAVHRWGRRGRL